MATRKKKIGFVNFQRPDMKVKKKWKSYRFEVNANYFFYCKADNVHKPDGMVVLGSITKLETNAVKDTTYPLQVYFRGKPQHGNSSSPWVMDLTSNDERMEWMECLIPGSSKDLQRFARPGSINRMMSPDQPQQPAAFTVAASRQDGLRSNGSFHGDPSTPQDYMDFTPVDSVHSGRVGEDSESSRYSGAPVRQPYTVGTASTGSTGSHGRSSAETRAHGQNKYATNYPQGRNNASGIQTAASMPSIDLDSSGQSKSPQPNPRQDPHRHTYGHGGQKTVNTELPRKNRSSSDLPEYKPQAAARSFRSPRQQPTISSTEQELPEVPWDVHSKDEREKSNSPVHHLYEMDITTKGTSKKNKTLPQSRNISRALHKGTSTEKEGEFDPVDDKEGEFDSRYDTPRKPVPAVRRSLHSKPTAVPRKKKGAAISLPPIQHEYLDLMAGEDSEYDNEQERRDKYLQDLRELGLNPQVVNFSADQLKKLRAMLQGGHQHEAALFQSSSTAPNMLGNSAEPINYVDSFPTDKILVTDEDSEDSYEPRPDWAKAIGLDASRKRPQLSSGCDALLDLQEEALYIRRSSVTDFQEIGEGQFGKVFRAVMQRGKAKPFTVAVKTAKKSTSEQDKTEFLREMNVMSQMRHPNIVQLHGIIRDDVPAPWIVLEFLKNGDLKHFLIKNPRPVETLVKYMIDVAMGMHYLSEKGLVHRDLAARNVLINKEETCKVSDFGLLRELPRDDSIYHMNTAVPCPVRWMAPESIDQRYFSPASDVWSFGILQWEMFYPNKMPYHDLGNIEVAMKLMKGHRLDTPPDCPSVVSRIMKACWHQIPEKRPSFLLITTLLSTKV